MRRALIATAASLAAALAWAWLVAVDSRWIEGAGTMVAASLVALTATAVVGALLAASRWAKRLLTATATAGLGLGLSIDIGPLWIGAALLSAYAIAESAGSGLDHVVRGRAAAGSPPPEAAAIPLLALAHPGALGLAQPSGVDAWDWVLAGAVVAIGFAYAKAVPGALLMTRLALPLAAAAGFAVTGWPAGWIPAVLALAAATLAWTKNARIAVAPLARPGRAVPIPPELTPREILDGAGIDDRGRSLQ